MVVVGICLVLEHLKVLKMTYNISAYRKIYTNITSSSHIVLVSDPSDTVFISNSSSNSVNFYLPDINTVPVGRKYHFKRGPGAFNVRIYPGASDSIDQGSAGTSRSLSGLLQPYTIISNGSQWFIISFGLN